MFYLYEYLKNRNERAPKKCPKDKKNLKPFKDWDYDADYPIPCYQLTCQKCGYTYGFGVVYGIDMNNIIFQLFEALDLVDYNEEDKPEEKLSLMGTAVYSLKDD